MTSLLINREIKSKTEKLLFQEQKKTSDLELGKALHLLLTVPVLVLEKACHSAVDPLLTLQSPVHGAIHSIENYLKSHENGYKSIYDSLKEKILKKSSSASALCIASYFYSVKDRMILEEELSKQEDTRSQLAAVLLLDDIINKKQHSSNKKFIPALVTICESQRKPTLLAYKACEACLDCTESLIEMENNSNSDNKITELYTASISKDKLCLDQMIKIVHIVKEWRGDLLSELEKAAYDAIDCFLNHMNIDIEEDAWRIFIKLFRPKPILSEKPLTEKKFNTLFQKESTSPFVSMVKLILFILFQKTHIEQNMTPETRSIIQAEYKNMAQNMNGLEVINVMLPALLNHLPTIFDYKVIADSPSMITSLLDQPVSPSNMNMIKSIALDNFHLAKDKIIPRALQGTDQSRALIESIIQEQTNNNNNNCNSTVSEIADTLLVSVKQSPIACELVLQCLPFLNSLEFIYKLIRLTYNEESPKEKTICMALISKALLLDESNTNVLVYIDMIRTIFYNKGLFPFYLPTPLLDQLKPNQLPLLNKPDIIINDEKGAYVYASSLLGSIELWSRKANPEVLKHGLVLLLNKCFGTALDAILVDTWRYLSFAILRDHDSLVWPVLEGCLFRMNSPMANTDSAKKVLLTVNPLLILQTIPKDAFNQVSLTKNHIHFIKEKMARIGIDASQLLRSSEAPIERGLTKSLLDELLSRALDESQEDSIKELSLSLIQKIYCF